MSSFKKAARANWWPFKPQTSIFSVMGLKYMQAMASMVSSSEMQKNTRSMSSWRKSPDHMTWSPWGNSAKGWNQLISLVGSL